MLCSISTSISSTYTLQPPGSRPRRATPTTTPRPCVVLARHGHGCAVVRLPQAPNDGRTREHLRGDRPSRRRSGNEARSNQCCRSRSCSQPWRVSCCPSGTSSSPHPRTAATDNHPGLWFSHFQLGTNVSDTVNRDGGIFWRWLLNSVLYAAGAPPSGRSSPQWPAMHWPNMSSWP